MEAHNELFGLIVADVLIAALVAAAVVLIGVFTYRVIMRTRRRSAK